VSCRIDLFAGGNMKRRDGLCTRREAAAKWLTLIGVLVATSGAWGADTYDYDELGRLKGVTLSDGTRIDYALDAAGNRKTLTTTPGNPNPPDTTPPTDPTGLAATVVNASRIDLSWTGSTDNPGGSGLASYRIERCSGSGCSNFAELTFTTGPSYSDTSVAGVTTYQYRVRARDVAGNNSGYSNTAVATTPDGTPPTAPTSLRLWVAPTSTSVWLLWDAATDNVALGTYRVERCTGANCSSFAEIGTLNGNAVNPSYNDTTTAGTTTYVYRVKARDTSGNDGPYSNTLTVSTPDTIAPSVPMNLQLNSPNSNTVNLSWSASTDTGGSGLAGYQVFRNGSFFDTTAVTNYTDLTVVGSTQYTYTVRAYDNASNFSPQSGAQTITTGDTLPPNAPTNAVATAVSDTRIDVSAFGVLDNGGSGVAGYRLYRSGVLVATATVPSFSDTGLSPNTTYFYTVRAYDNANNESADSNVTSATTQPPGAPLAPHASTSQSQITAGGSYTVSWTTPANTEYFELYRRNLFVTNDFSLVYSGTATSLAHTSVPAGEYESYVLACNTSGCSPASNVVFVQVCPSSGCN
jgi:chitodextrinase